MQSILFNPDGLLSFLCMLSTSMDTTHLLVLRFDLFLLGPDLGIQLFLFFFFFLDSAIKLICLVEKTNSCKLEYTL